MVIIDGSRLVAIIASRGMSVSEMSKAIGLEGSKLAYYIGLGYLTDTAALKLSEKYKIIPKDYDGKHIDPRALRRDIHVRVKPKPYKPCRHKDCVYHASPGAVNNCDYICITGHSRGCPPEGCTKYEKGPAKRRVVSPFKEDFI